MKDASFIRRNRTSILYSFLQGIFWMVYGIVIGFAVVYLKDKGFNYSSIGMILSVGNILSIVVQTFLASLVDRIERFSMLHVMILFMGMFTLLCGLMNLSLNTNMIFIIYILMAIICTAVPTFMNALAMDYINSGENLNFGLARGMGSICFAVLSSCLGGYIIKYGTGFLFPVALIGCICLLALTILLSATSHSLKVSGEKLQVEDKGTSLIDFVRTYPKFMGFLVGCGLIFIAHTAINTYHINLMERVHGSEADMGISLGLAAAVELPVMAAFTWIITRFDFKKVLKFSLIAFIIKMLALVLATSVIGILASQLLQAASFALFALAGVYYTNHLVKPIFRSRAQALLGVATYGLAGTIANYLGGKVIDSYSVSVFLMGCMVLSVIGLIIALICTE